MELVDEQAAVREDQHADGAAGVDEAGGGDGLARRGRVLEAVAADRARIVDLGLGGGLGLLGVLVARAARARSSASAAGVLVGVVVVVLVVGVVRRPRRPRRPRPRPRRPRPRRRASSPSARRQLVVGVSSSSSPSASSARPRAPRRGQRGEHARERVDLMRPQREAVERAPAIGREHALEAEHEREAEAPGRARGVEARCRSPRRAASSARRRAVPGASVMRRVVPVVQQRLAAPGRDLCGGVHEFEFFHWLRHGGDRQFAQQRAPSKASAG